MFSPDPDPNLTLMSNRTRFQIRIRVLIKNIRIRPQPRVFCAPEQSYTYELHTYAQVFVQIHFSQRRLHNNHGLLCSIFQFLRRIVGLFSFFVSVFSSFHSFITHREHISKVHTKYAIHIYVCIRRKKSDSMSMKKNNTYY